MGINSHIIMGISGCGKSTIARQLAEELDWDFFNAENFHRPDNIAKMKSGIPLSDSDPCDGYSVIRLDL